MLAKSTYVWLDQLSRKYQRPITRLDQIPDEELDTLARWGFSGLWLIGLWERSRASQRIKQLMGNPEAVASAYSLFDYQIAADLGGEEAYRNLAGARLAARHPPGQRHGAQPHGHRFQVGDRASRLVPRRWTTAPSRPTPSTGRTCLRTSRVGIFLEDHYYNRTDAAVVFKRVDRWTGSARYIYHGNDGTSMPWNDTAQLNYLNPDSARGGDPDHPPRGAQVPHHPLRRGHDAGQAACPAPLVPGAGHRRGHRLAGGTRHDEGPVRRGHARRILARGGGPGGAGSAGHAAAGRSLLDDGRLFRPHPGHAPGLQQRVHEHAEGRRQRQVPRLDQERAGIRSGNPEALRQLHEQPGRRDRRGAVRQGRQVLRRLHADGHHAGPAHDRARPGRGLSREVRHGIPPRVLGRAAGRATWSGGTSGRSSR